jgi:tRNA(Ile)-lysidine synthase
MSPTGGRHDKKNRNVPDFLAAALAGRVPGYPDARLCVALSGGVDSVALLHAASVLCGREPRLGLRAIHVDHGLQSASRQWAEHCRTICGKLGVALEVVALRLSPARGASVEARRERYAALAARLLPGERLLTAHHADDQLETVLLQLFRGSGVAGLAAMPASVPLGAGSHLRPLLDVPRSALVDWARAAGLEWIEDPMNSESRYDRAYLRHDVLPVIARRWPAVSRTVGRSAGHLADAQKLLEALARADGETCVDAQGRLAVAGLADLPRARQANLLRAWIASQGLGPPSAARLGSILGDVVPARDDAQPVVTWPDGEVRRYRGRLHAMRPLEPLPPPGWERTIRPGETVELPAGLGHCALESTVGEGLAAASLQGPLTVGFRPPGARLRPAGRRDAHTLGNLCQEAGILPWMRPRLPLLLAAGRVVAAPGLWIAAEAAAAAGAAALRLSWRGGPPCR